MHIGASYSIKLEMNSSKKTKAKRKQTVTMMMTDSKITNNDGDDVIVYVFFCLIMMIIIKQHRMQKMRIIAIDDPVNLCGFTWLRCANTAKRIELLLACRLLGTQGTLY